MIPYLLFLSLLTPIAATWAAAPAAEDPWYEIEVIVFEHARSQGGESARWSDEARLPPLAGTIDLDEAPGMEGDEPVRPDLPIHETGQPGFRKLADPELRLSAAMNRLIVAQGYAPLLHVAWRQPVTTDPAFQGVRIHNGAPGEDAAQAPVVEPASDTLASLSGIDSAMLARAAPALPAPGLEGAIRLSRARFLHLGIDLRYRIEPDAQPGAVFSLFTRQRPTVEVFRLQQSKRVRSDELHYFDHPRFGAIVLVTPFDAPTDTGSDP